MDIYYLSFVVAAMAITFSSTPLISRLAYKNSLVYLFRMLKRFSGKRKFN